MNLQSKYSDLMLNLLVALAISLVVNFSYVLLLIVEQKGEGQPRPARASVVTRSEEGVLRRVASSHSVSGAITRKTMTIAIRPKLLSAKEKRPMQRIRRMDLSDGDRLVVDVVAPRRYGAHPVMNELRMRNGEEFDYSTLYNRPSRTSELTLQLIYYLVVSFIMLSILTSARRNYKAGRFALHCMGCLVAAAALYIFAPVREWHSGQIVLNFMSGHIFDYMLLLKCSFAVAVSMLYGWVYVLNSKQQAVVMENERLKNENLTTRYNMLVGQINPHFFFNSLNSLAMLVREKHDDKALTYIDQLSYTFRYIIQNGQSTLMTLDEELKFIEAYSYLFEIRYADKLVFDIDVDDKYRSWTLPLIGNAVKHNTITRSKPFHISIRTEQGWLVVANPKVPKIEPEPSTGIGLENLRNRWHLITGRDIEIIDTDKEFVVRMPLQKPVIG